jgi:class 3 adenylate cyclase/tetratricopeptide (TPR) repeat protein
MAVASTTDKLVACPSCDEANPARFRLCGFCGAQLRADRPSDEIRRYVTVVNSDLKGSTALGERLDPESLREVLTRYFDEMQIVFESHGGTIEKIIGDAVVAVFGLPVKRDDDALRAVRAAAQTMRVLASLNDQLEAVWGVRLVTRTGVSTGEVIVGDVSASQHVLTGETIRVSSAMEQNAPPLEVLIAQPTYDLVRELVEVEAMGPITPKGMDQATEAYRLISVAEPPNVEADGADGAASPGAIAAPDVTKLCPNCGEANPAAHRLCGMCGAPLVLEAKAQESRKTVTLVFADPKPRTDSGEPPSPEALRDVMSRYFDEMKRALERHGGTVEKFIGDAVMAVFGLPVRHEDDAVRALRAALDMQAALPALNEDFAAKWGVRLLNAIGVNTGEVIAGDATLGQRLVTGDAVNVAARLEQAAGPAEVIIGDLTYRLAKDAIEVEAIEALTLKGKAEPVPAYRLLAMRSGTAEAGSVSPFVGREVEMGRLAVGLREAEAKHEARMVTVVGDAGVGKSRLIKEFATQAGVGARVLRGRCLPYGDGITFWPLAEVVREASEIAADDPAELAIAKLDALLEREGSDPAERRDVVDRIAAAIGLSPAQFPITELFWGSRRLLEAMGRDRPLLVIIDDIHSAEQTFLELLDHVEAEARGASIVLLCSARHELAEAHADWSEAHAANLIVLRPLSDADSGKIVEELLGASGLDPSVVARITSAAEGNPLFVEQMVSMLIDTGALHQEDGRWVAAAASEIAVPPTIHALLAARFDSLGAGEKQVLEPASVIGLLFPVAAVSELVAEGARPMLESNLGVLNRKQFVLPDTVDEDDAFKFAHLLVRDTAYGSLLKRARASYHERFVDWAERINAERGRGQEFEEIHGYHLEQAYQYRVALGVIDDPARRLGERGAAKLASAGRRALGRGDLPAAANLLGRSVALLPPENPFRIELMPDLAEALVAQGEREAATQVLVEAEAAATAIDDARLRARASLLHVMVRQMGSGSVSTEAAIAEGQRDIGIFEGAGDHAGLARAWRLLAQTYNNVGRFAEASDAADQIVRHAIAAEEPRLAARAATTKAYSLLLGPVPADEAIRQCEELISQVGGDRRAEAIVSGSLSVLHAMRGSFDQARELYVQQRTILEGLGRNVAALTTSINSARVELLAGDPEAAEREARRDFDALGALDETYFRSTVAGMLARALYEGERFDEARTVADEARALTADDDFESQVLWRGVAARLGARTGRADEALELTESQARLAAETASPVFEAEARRERAEVLVLLGRQDEAEPPLREALQLFEQKGDLVSAARIRLRLESLATV